MSFGSLSSFSAALSIACKKKPIPPANLCAALRSSSLVKACYLGGHMSHKEASKYIPGLQEVTADKRG